MYKQELNININADLSYFNSWLKLNFSPNYNGCSQGDKLYLFFNSEPNELDKLEVENYYYSITELDCLNVYKTRKMLDMKLKTDDLIKTHGFVFEVSPNIFNTFSLVREINGFDSSNPQTNILALYTSRNEISYPIIYNTIDDLNFFSVTDSATIENMYFTALASKKTLLDGETYLLSQVRSATSKSQIEAIIDNR